MDNPDGAIDWAQFASCQGRRISAIDVVTPQAVARFEAVFAEQLARVDRQAAPLGFHWTLAPDAAPRRGLGLDGHPVRGGFLPPIPLPNRMWAGGEIEWLDPLRIGDGVTRVSTIEEIAPKAGRSGPLCFVAVRHDYRTERGLAIRERQDIVFRAATAGGKAAEGKLAQAEFGPPDFFQPAIFDPVTLFRYSALTFNGHRIHYDLPYATQVEAYPGLVVHGPLQASLLLNAAALCAGKAPRRFVYRGAAPLFGGAGAAVGAVKSASDRSVACWMQNAEARLTMTGVATW